MSNVTYQAYVQALGSAGALTGAELIALIQSGNPVQIALSNLGIALNSNLPPANGIYVPAANTIGFANNSLQTGTLTAAVMTMPAYAVTGSTVPANGIYLPSANTLGFAVASGQAGTISSTKQWSLWEPNFSAAALKSAATMDSGSFTGTFTGMSGATTGTINWTRSGNTVTLRAAVSITGTSNASTMTMTGLPAALSPTAEVKGICAVTDSGTSDIPGQVDIVGGTTTLLFFKYNGTQYLQTAFTGTGTKGIASGWTYTYPLQ